MHKRYRLMVAAILVVAGAAASHAAPVGGLAGHLAAKTDAVGWERVALRRCWQRGGARHCRSYHGGRVAAYHSGNGGADYYDHEADKLPFGTTVWWDQMLRENRGRN